MGAAPLPYLRDVAYTEHFAFKYLVEPSSDLTALTKQADEVYRYVSDRLGVSIDARVTVTVEERLKEPCPTRGSFIPRASDEPPSLAVYVAESTPRAELLGVLAHELGHYLHAAGFGRFPSSAGLNEGLATWAAGRYWLRGQDVPSFASSVAASKMRNRRLRNTYGLETSRGAGCLARRSRLYTEWAAFIDFLVRAYGVPTFKQLLASGSVTVDPETGRTSGTLPSYRAVYGLTLRELEAMRLRRLSAK